MSTATVIKLVLIMLGWAICFPFITAGLDSAPHLTFAAMRALLAGAGLLALGVAFRRRFPSGLKVWMLLALTGFGATTLGFFGMFHAAEFVSPGLATVIASTQPLMAAVLAHAVLGEQLDRRGKIGLLFGFVGIVTITSPQLLSSSSGSSALGVAYISLAALGITISNVIIKRLAGTVDSLLAMGIQLLFGGLLLALAASFTESPSTTDWSIRFTLVLLVLAFLGTSLVYWLWFSVLETVELNRANAFSFLIPVFGLAIGIALFEEDFGWLDALGATMTVFGIELVIRGRQGARAAS